MQLATVLLLLLLAGAASASSPSAETLCPDALVLNSYNFPTHYVTRNGKGSLMLQRGNGTRFKQRLALNGKAECISLEALTMPGHFFYNNDNMIYIRKNDNSASFKNETSFKLVKGHEGFVRLVSCAHPNHFVRHQYFKLKLNKWSKTDLFNKDSMFGIVCTNSKQFKLDICTGKFKLISKNYPKMKVTAGIGKISRIAKTGSTKLRFRSPALNGNPRAVSLESADHPNHFLTTLHDHNVVEQPFKNTAEYKAGASFKLVVMRNGYVRLQSVSNPRHYVRHSAYRLRLDRWADNKLYDDDSSWKIHCYVVPCHTKHFVYNPSYEHAKGPHCEFAPSNWPQINPHCVDKAENRPSPIRVKTAHCKKRAAGLKKIHLGAGWHKEAEFLVRNNGHSLQANAVNSAELTVSGGNMKGKFNCFQFHFHWGSVENMKKGIGSEHLLYDASGKKLPTPMEVHIVCKKESMNVSAAVNTADAIAVLGGFIHPFTKKEVHDGWAGHVVAQVLLNFAALKAPAAHGSKASGSVEKVQLQLRDLLPESIHKFINYDGAFTTPGCNPVAQWHLFPEPMKVRWSLMKKFAATFFDASKKRPLVDNFRPVQKRHGRELRCSFGN